MENKDSKHKEGEQKSKNEIMTEWTVEDIQMKEYAGIVDLSFCNLHHIPSAIYELVASKDETNKVTAIDLTGNQIESVDFKFFEIQGLKKILLEGNPIEALVIEDQNTELNELKVNPYTLVWSSAHVREYVTNLNWPLEVTEKYREEQNMKLDLQFCDLKVVPVSVTRMTNVKYVNLNFNFLTYFPSSLATEMKLERLAFEGNMLDRLDFEGNMINIPQIVLKGGTEMILSYLRAGDKNSDFIINTNRRVVIFGKFCSGKTSFVKTMIHGKPILENPAERTEVAAQHYKEFKVDDTELKVHFDDLGGQAPYEEPSRLFWNDECINILTVNAYTCYLKDDTNDFKSSVLVPLEDLSEHVKTPKVMFLLTHADELNDAKIQEVHDDFMPRLKRDLETKGEQIKRKLKEPPAGLTPEQQDAYAKSLKEKLADLHKWVSLLPKEELIVSSKTEVGVKEARNVILSTLTDVTNFSRNQIPKTWQTFRDIMARSKKQSAQYPWISKEEAETLGQKSGIESDKLRPALKFLRECGDIFWWEDNDRLCDKIFHQPKKVIELIATVINHDLVKHVKECKGAYGEKELDKMVLDITERGELSVDMIEYLWQKKYDISPSNTKEKLPWLLELLEKLEFCYMNKEEKESTAEKGKPKAKLLFPYLLTSEKPNLKPWENFSWEAQLILCIDFARQSPRSFFHILLIRLHSDRNIRLRKHWKNGILLKTVADNMAMIEIEERTDDDIFHIHMRGKERDSTWSDALQIHSLAASILNEKWPGAIYNSCVELKCPTCSVIKPYFLSEIQTIITCDECWEEIPLPIQSTDEAFKKAHAKLERYVSFLRVNTPHLTTMMEFSGQLLNRLYATQVISKDQLNKIRAKHLSKEKAEILLDFMEKKPGPKIAQFFVELEHDENEDGAATILQELDPSDRRDIFE